MSGSSLRRFEIALLLTLIPGLLSRAQTSRPASQPAAFAATTQPTLPNMTLTLAWNRERYEVPPPAMIPEQMQRSEAFQQWWQVGDARTLEWTDESGRRYVAEMWGRIVDERGRKSALIPYLSQYRADGTLEIKTTNAPDGQPNEWTIYAADGKTPVLSVTNRLSGIEGTPFIQYVRFLEPDGRMNREYQANRHGVVYIEWFYNERGTPERWNGSSKLDGPLPAEE